MELFIMLGIGMMAGIMLGGIIAFNIQRSSTAGILLVVDSDEGDPYLLLELYSDPQLLYGKQYVTMKVHHKNLISHK